VCFISAFWEVVRFEQGTVMEAPSQTLYLNNINEKIKKNVLKKTLYALFSQFGKVIEIVACRGIKLRGQVLSQNHSWSEIILMDLSFLDRPGSCIKI
jgi:RNA recognition motif-containing protein